MNAAVVYPVQVLREHVTALQAAISVCLADPDHKPVHKLRTETRRVEAFLLLLGLIPDVPEHRKQTAAMLRALRKLRRAAGSVRDLDVHRKMLEAFAEAEQAIAQRPAGDAVAEEAQVSTTKQREAKKTQPKKAGVPPETDATQKAAALLSEAAAELRDELGHDRDKAADELQAVLKKRQIRTTEAAEALMNTLDSAKDLALPAPALLRDAEAMLTRDGLLEKGPITALDQEELHSLRKAAKKARYLAESLPGDAALAAAASRFEALQEAGGQWHDALQIARTAQKFFGKGHELTGSYRAERDRKLATYRAALASSMPPASKRPGRASERSKEPSARVKRSAAKKTPVKAA